MSLRRDLRDVLLICEDNLPVDTHRIYKIRIRFIWRILNEVLAYDEDTRRWSTELNKLESESDNVR
jgi:hypothetical protein